MIPFETALNEYGEEEIVGSKTNPRVLEYFIKSQNSWVKDDETAWCAAFVAYCLETANIKSTRKLNATSYMAWGKPTTKPKLGDIVVFWRISPTSGYGHVAFFVKERNGFIYTLGGNQSNMVCIEKYPKSQLLGYRTY